MKSLQSQVITLSEPNSAMVQGNIICQRGNYSDRRAEWGIEPSGH